MRRKMPRLPISRFAHGISTSFLPRFGVVKGVVSSLLNLSINERGGTAAPPPPLATSLIVFQNQFIRHLKQHAFESYFSI